MALQLTTSALRPVAVLGLALALGACGGADVSFSGAGTAAPAPAADVETSPSTDGDTSPAPGTMDGQTVVLPEFPVFRVPDVSSLTVEATKTQRAIAAEVDLPPGLEVTGARCDSAGGIVNRSGATIGGGDDGSQVSSRAGISNVHGDGTSSLVSEGVVYNVHADGDGSVVTADAVLSVHADGSGSYNDDDIVYNVHADGAGSVVDGENVFNVDADGSGSWVGPNDVIYNNGDGTGSWVGDLGRVEVNGDGTGELLGEPVKVAPMADFALLGKLPKLTKLGPIGKPCGTLIRISAGLLFDFDKADVRPEAKPVLAAVAKALAGSSAQLEVNGHTDAKGADDYNLDLSDRRAQAVVAALTAAGLDAPMGPTGFGETQPVAPNTLKSGQDNPVGRQLNRRVEIVIPNS